MRWVLWAPMVVLVASASEAHAQRLVAVEGPMTMEKDGRSYLLDKNGHVLESGVVTPAGRALCAEMKFTSDQPCEWDTILDGAQRQTDPALWIIDISTDPDWPAPCWRPVALEVFSEDGVTMTVSACHLRAIAPPLPPAALDRLETAARRLQNATPKTLAQEQAAREFDAVAQDLEKSAR